MSAILITFSPLKFMAFSLIIVTHSHTHPPTPYSLLSTTSVVLVVRLTA